MVVNLVVDLVSAAVGYVAAVFTPAIAGEVKSWFVATASVVEKDASAVGSAVLTEVKKL
jgi:hypothetical protein